jgi:hypothetical protein
MSKRKREQKPFDVADFIRPGGQALDTAVNSLLEGRVPSPPAQPSGQPVDKNQAQLTPASQPAGIRVVGLRALSRNGEQSVFQLHTDALKLVIDLAASDEWVNSALRFDADFQLVDMLSGRVRLDIWSRQLRVQWGNLFWIALGNNSGPDPRHFTTPAIWGLDSGLYIFRGLIEFGSTIVHSPTHEIAIRVSGSYAGR